MGFGFSGERPRVPGPGDVLESTLRGLIPRMIEEIFSRVPLMVVPGSVGFTLSCSMLEVYRERAYDLLVDADMQMPLQVSQCEDGTVWVPGATEAPVHNAATALQVFVRGIANRVTAATMVHRESSRSHAIFRLSVVREEIERHVRRQSQLFIVDLAGSEKVSKTGSTGLLLDEAKSINKSLLALGQVIDALTSQTRRVHVPYRESKLTRLLQNAFGGNSKTVLIICVSPCTSNAAESLAALRFGDRSQRIVNRPRPNCRRTIAELCRLLDAANATISTQSSRIAFLREQVERLTEELSKAGNPESSIPAMLLASGTPEAAASALPSCFVSAEPAVSPTSSASVTPLSLTPPRSPQLHPSRGLFGVSMPQPSQDASMVSSDVFHFVCPLSRHIMSDPVFASDGFTYERSAIEGWLAQHKLVSPVTGERLLSAQLIPNKNMRGQIRLRAEQLGSVSFFDFIGDPLLLELFSHLSWRDLVAAGQCCQRWRRLAHDGWLWSLHFASTFPEVNLKLIMRTNHCTSWSAFALTWHERHRPPSRQQEKPRKRHPSPSPLRSQQLRR